MNIAFTSNSFYLVEYTEDVEPKISFEITFCDMTKMWKYSSNNRAQGVLLTCKFEYVNEDLP